MLVRRTELLGRCGGASPQRPSSFLCVLPGGWCPEPDSHFVPFRSCRPQCCCHTDPGSWTGTVRLAWYEYRRYRSPICCLVFRHENPGSVDFHICAAAHPSAANVCGGESLPAGHISS